MNRRFVNSAIIAVASGKGGVGKTFLAASFSYELSLGNRVLIVDLDFYNRGLTGLFRRTISTEKCIRIEHSSLLTEMGNITWCLTEVKANCDFLYYDTQTASQCIQTEFVDVAMLVSALKQLLADVVKFRIYDYVIFDCHGGPDKLSLAAFLVATKRILISEPDRISMFGTFNFLWQFSDVIESSMMNVYLMFNRTPLSFSYFSLERFYRLELASEFKDYPLLAVIPSDDSVAKITNTNPFVVSLFPHSLLAQKVRLSIRTLFRSGVNIPLPSHLKVVPEPINSLHRILVNSSTSSIIVKFFVTIIIVFSLFSLGLIARLIDTKDIDKVFESSFAADVLPALVLSLKEFIIVLLLIEFDKVMRAKQIFFFRSGHKVKFLLTILTRVVYLTALLCTAYLLLFVIVFDSPVYAFNKSSIHYNIISYILTNREVIPSYFFYIYIPLLIPIISEFFISYSVIKFEKRIYEAMAHIFIVSLGYIILPIFVAVYYFIAS